MKKFLKNSVFFLFRVCSKINTTAFSRFFISWGYAIKSEALYNQAAVQTFEDRLPMHNYLSTQLITPGEQIRFMEFGVYRGQTYAIWVNNNKNPQSSFAGFDTFTGLPEDWGSEKKGSFSAKGKLPDIRDQRSRFYIGLIQDTLPDYVKGLAQGIKNVIHIDVDLYNASLVTLIYLQPFIKKGDIIIFDDFFTITKAQYEFRAFLDFLSLYKVEYKPVVKCRNGHFVIEIL